VLGLFVGSWLDLFGRNLSKKGWLGFSPIWGFPRINSCVFLCLLLLLLFSVHDINANVKEDLNILVNLIAL
jgi:hypothetical protein